MEPIHQKPDFSRRPVAGMIVILFAALFIGGWLYVDAVRNELESKVEAADARTASVKSALTEFARQQTVQTLAVSSKDQDEKPFPLPGTPFAIFLPKDLEADATGPDSARFTRGGEVVMSFSCDTREVQAARKGKTLGPATVIPFSEIGCEGEGSDCDGFLERITAGSAALYSFDKDIRPRSAIVMQAKGSARACALTERITKYAVDQNLGPHFSNLFNLHYASNFASSN